MRTLIINLDGEKQRMAFQIDQMQRLGLDYKRLPAITVADIPAEEIAEKAAQWERPMRAAEVACLYSHCVAWKMVAKANKPMLILEDDALLSSQVPEILAKLDGYNSADHVTLEARSRKKILAHSPQKLTEKSNILRLFQDRTGAAAYILWPRGAEILLQKAAIAAGLADAIIAATYEMSSWQIEPAAAIQLDQCTAYGVGSPLETKSTIDSRTNQKPSPDGLFSSLKFKWRRIKAQLRMGLRQFSSQTKAGRRFVTVEIEDFQVHINR